MKFHILTLFPEMILQGLGWGVIARAAKKGMIQLNPVNIRDYTADRHGKVDDYPYGGGAGMLLQAQPVWDAYRAVAGERSVRTVYVTPQGERFTQKKAKELAAEEELIFLCGHYEGIDERVLEETVTDYVSIGDYILTGGELAAMVMIDAVARLIPGVLGNEHSAGEESFFNDLLEYPQYTRPEVWHGKKVPEALLSGSHSRIRAWRLEQSRERTAVRRPDLYGRYEAKQLALKRLLEDKRNNIHMTESLNRGQGEILYTDLYAGGENILIYDYEAKVCMLTAACREDGRKLAGIIPAEAELLVVSQPFMEEILTEGNCSVLCRCCQVLYTQKTALPVRRKDIRRLEMDSFEAVCSRYRSGSKKYIRERIQAGAMYGCFAGGKLTGFIGVHREGSLGMLYVEDACRRQGMGEALEAFAINRMLERGWTPYGHVVEGNDASVKLQEKLGLYRASKTFCWLEKSTCI